MNATAYYNEHDSFAVAWLRQLIAGGHIAPGVVDDRDIQDVTPDDLQGFTQCHFFAGIGVWSYALRRAGWDDDRPIWTGSCPCQPFSTAGKGEGFADERHLWPAWQWLVEQCGPQRILGEQVADSGADAWIDLVHADLEGMGYAFGCVPLASAGFGAPNPRHRSFWVADAESLGHERRRIARHGWDGFAHSSAAIRLADAASLRQSRVGRSGEAGASECRHADRLGHALRDGAEPVGGNRRCAQGQADRVDGHIPGASVAAGDASAIDGLADAGRVGWGEGGKRDASAGGDGTGQCGDAIRLADTVRAGRPERRSVARDGPPTRSGVASNGTPGPVNGFWRNADWLYCRDPRGPRWRPVDCGAFPLAPSTPARVGTLRGSGNAINAEVATAFIEAVMACT